MSASRYEEGTDDMALSTTIMQLRERERDAREAELDRPRTVESWRHDIRKVYDVIRGALKVYEIDGSATIRVEDVEVSEELLGSELYERLVIEIVGRRIIASPVARFTIGGTGRIDMYRDNRPTEDHRVFIVRGFVEPGLEPSSWLIEQKGDVPIGPHGPLLGFARGKRRYHNLEPSSVETAVEYLLKLP